MKDTKIQRYIVYLNIVNDMRERDMELFLYNASGKNDSKVGNRNLCDHKDG